MKTLLELIPEFARLGEREAVLYHDGYRVRKWTYEGLSRRVAAAAGVLDERGLTQGDRVLVWSENRPEWLAVFWGALARGITVVPIDFRSSADFVNRVQGEVSAGLLVHGASVELDGVELDRLFIEDACPPGSDRSIESVEPVEASSEDEVQILYTSGTTGKPKGIVHRHRHLVANLEPIRKEIDKYSLYARPFQPIRLLDLLPLSHVFGQFTGIFIPPVLGGSVGFVKEIHPGAIIEAIRSERISVLIAVPRFLGNLRRHIERRYRLPDREPLLNKGLLGGLARWWQHRHIHSAFGWKFWAILSGGARLPPEEEGFWFRLGFVLVQGYGLTETSSLVSTNHPFHPVRGSLGKAVGDQEVRLADDGEILVRGENVSREIYGQEEKEEEDEEDGWLRTGDIGEIGPDGTIYYKGRKKDVIVGPEGLNVYPMDVESVLEDAPEVKESVVIGRSTDEGELVHAVLLLRDRDADAGAVIQKANRELEPHQRIREWTVWEEEDFPRTSSTYKVRRHEIEEAVGRGEAARGEEEERETTTARSILARQLGRDADSIHAAETLSEDLGLSSLDRIELMTKLEEHYGVELSEAEMSRIESLGELEHWLEEESSGARPRADAEEEAAAEEAPKKRAREPEEPPPSAAVFSGFVRLGRRQPIRFVREAFRRLVMLPLFRRYLPLEVEGSVEATPVILAPNHESNLDTIAVLAALPPKIRRRLAPTISWEYFRPYLEKSGSFRERISLALQYWLAIVLVNVFPLPQSTRGVRRALQFAGRLADEGYSILIFPEGVRTPDGEMREFRAGVGLMAARLQLPVVPVHLDGLYEILPAGASWPKTGKVRVRFGEPIRFPEDVDYREAAKRVEEEVRKLGDLPIESDEEGEAESAEEEVPAG